MASKLGSGVEGSEWWCARMANLTPVQAGGGVAVVKEMSSDALPTCSST